MPGSPQRFLKMQAEVGRQMAGDDFRLVEPAPIISFLMQGDRGDDEITQLDFSHFFFGD